MSERKRKQVGKCAREVCLQLFIIFAAKPNRLTLRNAAKCMLIGGAEKMVTNNNNEKVITASPGGGGGLRPRECIEGINV